MKRKINNKKTNKIKSNNTLIARNISTNTSSVKVNVLYTLPVYLSNSTQNLSFSTSSDVRYLGFSSVLTTNTYPFADFATVYEEFKIVSAYLVATPYSNLSISLPPMHLTCDPDGALSNPTNLTVINSSNGHLFYPGMVEPESVYITFPGVGSNTNTWLDISASPTGAFYIGMDTTGIGGISNTLVFSCSFKLEIQFRGIRGR